MIGTLRIVTRRVSEEERRFLADALDYLPAASVLRNAMIKGTPPRRKIRSIILSSSLLRAKQGNFAYRFHVLGVRRIAGLAVVSKKGKAKAVSSHRTPKAADQTRTAGVGLSPRASEAKRQPTKATDYA